MVRLLFVGPGHNQTFRSWIEPFLGEVEARLVTSEPVPEAFAAAHPELAVELLPRPLLRRLPRALFVHTLDYLVELRLRLARFRPHVVHLHYASQLDALALAWLPRAPLLITVYGADVLEDQLRRALPVDLLVRRLFAGAAAITAKSPFLADACRALGARAERIHPVPWGLDPAQFAPVSPGERAAARRRLGLAADALAADAPLLLSPRLLHPLYNHDVLIDAAATLRERPTVLFLGACDPAYAAALRARARERGVAARFLPGVAHAAMPGLYAAADAVASVPASDGLPQTLLEAAACERPAVTLDLPAYRHLPFAADALLRAPQVGGRVTAADLRVALQAALAAGPRPGLAAARQWVVREASFADSVERVRGLYRALAGRATR